MLGDKVKELRDKQGLTQGQLATKAKLKREHLSQIETGVIKEPSAKVVIALASALRVDPDVLFEAAGHPVKPPLRERRTPYEIMRELEESLPILVPETAQPASAGPGVWAEAEAWPYYPSPDERRHQFVAVPVVGDCMAPRLHDGERVIVDKDASPRAGDIVVAIHDGETLIKQLEKRDDQVWLVALRDRKPIKVDETTRIIGVVRMVMHRP